jgi:hypothetical protein
MASCLEQGEVGRSVGDRPTPRKFCAYEYRTSGRSAAVFVSSVGRGGLHKGIVGVRAGSARTRRNCAAVNLLKDRWQVELNLRPPIPTMNTDIPRSQNVEGVTKELTMFLISFLP